MKKNRELSQFYDINQYTYTEENLETKKKAENVANNEIIDINCIPDLILRKESVKRVDEKLDINVIIDDSYKEENMYKIDDNPGARASNNQLNFDNKFVYQSPNINLDKKMEEESIFCENCKKLIQVQIYYDDHLGMCFLDSDIYTNNNQSFDENPHKTLKQNNIENLENSPYIFSYQENIEEEKKVEDNIKCLKCGTQFQNPIILDIHSKSCIGKKWEEEEKIREKRLFSEENSFDFKQSHPFESIREESVLDHDSYEHFKRINFLRGLNSLENRVNYIPNNNNLYSNDNSLEQGSFESELSYNQMCELDENNANPLGKKYIERLLEEKLTKLRLIQLSEDDKKCLICLEEYKESDIVLRLPCLHVFHKADALEWFKKTKTCPVCRSNVEEMIKKM